ncbi:hypothetical protein LR48_Vigan05g095300 [Vigna angularis]|uniref:Peptidase M20 dimerisation domain-containing protein n=1 Tax=Phaseolus angularis TaxID=3914 RepID=A0A0L9ULB1_PHAAN|nr:uncharacterized protein HKW66_Vig0257580 [Vigna angularis]KOM43349.1 hypothetical protein LR48_Vigan05g095300 [Vigna angularis]
MNVGVVLDEGLASPDAHYRAFYVERSPWWLVIKVVGAPGHGSKLYDNSAMENLLKSITGVIRKPNLHLQSRTAMAAIDATVVEINYRIGNHLLALHSGFRIKPLYGHAALHCDLDEVPRCGSCDLSFTTVSCHSTTAMPGPSGVAASYASSLCSATCVTLQGGYGRFLYGDFPFHFEGSIILFVAEIAPYATRSKWPMAVDCSPCSAATQRGQFQRRSLAS